MEAPETLTALQKIASAQTASAVRFNTELVRSAWDAVQRRRREARRAAMRSASDLGSGLEPMPPDEDEPLDHGWIRQLWTDHIIVACGEGEKCLRIPYTVEAPGTDIGHVKFGTPEPVRVAYVAASRGEEALEQLLALRNVSPSERESLKGKGHTLPGTTSYPIKSLKDLNNAIQAYGRAKEEDRSRLKAHLLREAKRLGASDQVIERIRALGKSQTVKASMTGEEALGAIELARRTRANHGRFKAL